MLDISIVGAGRMGGALALALDRVGHTVSRLIYRCTTPQLKGFHRNPNIASINEVKGFTSDAIFITTQDSEIAAAARRLESLVEGSSSVFITSGALSSRSIDNLKDIGCKIGSVHPLVSISDPVLGAARFKGAYFCVEGDPEAVRVAETIVSSLKGHSFSIPTDKKPLYHAAAVASSGHLLALIDIAIGMLEKCGLDSSEAKKILLPLIESTIDNLKEQTIEESLTGTFARGDVETFESHLVALEKNADADLTRIYLALGLHSLEVADRHPGKTDTLTKLKERVLIAKRELR